MSRLHTWKFGLATGITFAALSVGCAAALAISADATIAVFNSFMHGVDVARLVPAGGRAITLGQIGAGAISLGAIGFVAGAILAGCYNMLIADKDAAPLTTDRRLA